MNRAAASQSLIKGGKGGHWVRASCFCRRKLADIGVEKGAHNGSLEACIRFVNALLWIFVFSMYSGDAC